MPATAITDEERDLINNIKTATAEENPQTKTNRHIAKFVAVRAGIPLAVIGTVVLVTRLLDRKNESDTDETNE